jgi:hypothetical protein
MIPATAFQIGDRVIGEADGERIFGTVVGLARGTENDVTVRWTDEDYSDPGFVGHLVPADLLRLWPTSAHEHRLATLGGSS